MTECDCTCHLDPHDPATAMCPECAVCDVCGDPIHFVELTGRWTHSRRFLRQRHPDDGDPIRAHWPHPAWEAEPPLRVGR